MSVESAQAAFDYACQFEREAADRYSLAKQAYNESLDRLRAAESNLSQGESVFNRFRISEDHYRADYSLIATPGAEALMRYVAKNDVKDAISKLTKILEVVSSYCDCPMVIGSAGRSYSYPGKDNYDRPSEKEQARRKEKALEDAGDRLRKDRPRDMPNPSMKVRCKVCGRPFYICRCKPSVLPDVK